MQLLKFLFLPLACATATAMAQLPVPAEENPDPLYRVEIVVFANLVANPGEEDFDHGGDNLPRTPPPPLLQVPALTLESVFTPFASSNPPNAPLEAALPTGPGEGLQAIEPPEPEIPADRLSLLQPFADQPQIQTALQIGPELQLPDGFRILAASELELGDAVAAMRRSRPYRVLGHVGWQQTGVDTDRSIRLDLKRLGITNPRGTIELYRRRFLHVVVDFEYFDGEGTFWQVPPGFGLAPLQYARRYQLADEANAIRSGEYWYIDHPMFGVLVRITPAPEPEDEADAQTDEQPAA